MSKIGTTYQRLRHLAVEKDYGAPSPVFAAKVILGTIAAYAGLFSDLL